MSELDNKRSFIDTPLHDRRQSVLVRADFYAFWPDEAIIRLPRTENPRHKIVMEAINPTGE